MSERKAWTEIEDSALKEIIEKRQIKKWSLISKIMEQEFGIHGRNGKQCRQRYHNHLDSSIKRGKWTELEERELVNHQNQIGNKWAQISKLLAGRSQNDIKNQFYSILRRGLRQINSTIRKFLRKYKQIKVSVLQKIVESGQLSIKGRSGSKMIVQSIELKKTIIHYAFIKSEIGQEDLGNVKKFIEKLKGLGKHVKQNDKGIIQIEENQSQSDEDQIDSAEYRDNCPVAEIKKDLEQKFRKNSFFNFTLQTPQIEVELKGQPKNGYRLRKRSSFCSNHSFDLNSPKWTEFSDPFKAFQLQETDNFSPRPHFYASSPYFDQSRTAFLWAQPFNNSDRN